MPKQKGKLIRAEKKKLYKNPAGFYEAKRKKAGQDLNQELNKPDAEQPK